MAKVVKCYRPDGTVQVFTRELSLEDIRERLNGYVEHVGLPTSGFSLFCDEDGRMKGLKPCLSLQGHLFVGDIYVGILSEGGLAPVDEKEFVGLDDNHKFTIEVAQNLADTFKQAPQS